MSATCQHTEAQLEVSAFGLSAGFRRARAGRADSTVYPAPLVLPGDALTDPEENYPQTCEEFLGDEDRNVVTSKRRTIYLVPPPRMRPAASFIRRWTTPRVAKQSSSQGSAASVTLEKIREYVEAFFHSMPVKLYDGDIDLIRHGKSKNENPAKIDCLHGDNMLLDIRTRACPDKTFERQLNLNDLIDVLMQVLPEDAYCMMMLVDHDLWEEDEDLFQCGRAYGASRVAVVSTARYNPVLDEDVGLDLEHAWPASHCRSFVEQFTSEHENQAGSVVKKARRTNTSTKKNDISSSLRGPIHSAITTYQQVLEVSDRQDEAFISGVWLSRVCRTVTHELGHCLGIDHCTYYACLMQSTSGLLEDARQPLYLCPVDEEKLSRAIHTTESVRHDALRRLLARAEWQADPTFAATHEWIRMKSA